MVVLSVGCVCHRPYTLTSQVARRFLGLSQKIVQLFPRLPQAGCLPGRTISWHSHMLATYLSRLLDGPVAAESY